MNQSTNAPQAGAASHEPQQPINYSSMNVPTHLKEALIAMGEALTGAYRHLDSVDKPTRDYIFEHFMKVEAAASDTSDAILEMISVSLKQDYFYTSKN